MSATYYVLGGDNRSYWAALHLRKNGQEVFTWGVPQLENSPLPNRFSATDRLVLPFPSFQGEKLRGETGICIQDLLERVQIGTKVFGCLFSAHRAAFEGRGAGVCDLYDAEPLTTANAVPTAEGAIQWAMVHSPIVLHGSRCLVIGFGRIGRVLAQKLHALSADVTVSARKDADCAMAEALGMRSDKTGVYHQGLSQFDFVFNTVPAQVLSEEQLGQLPASCVLIELASAPYGIPESVCRQLGLSYHLAAGLPGICAPATAGALYAEYILRCEEET